MAEFSFRALTFEDWAAEDASVFELSLDEKDGLRLKGAGISYEKDGYYMPKPLDSGIPDSHWHRIVIDADIPRNTYLGMWVFTSDNLDFQQPSPDDLSNLLPEPYTFRGDVRDLLVQAEPGRYVKLIMGFHGDGKETPVLRQVKVYYPRLSYLRYLPAIYQDDEESRDFLERFLSIFESMLYESEETISNLHTYFDPMATPDDFLRWLAGWLALDRYELLGEKNREFILRAVEFYKQKGTASGLANLVSFLTGRECCVKEYMNNVFRSYGREHHEADKIKDTGQCFRFFHGISKTVDTDPQHDIISKIGDYSDEIHYTFDSRPDGKYSPHSVGLFIFLKPGETLQINEDELKKIIDAFLPVFIHVDITTVEFFEESYSLDNISESYEDEVYDHSAEEFTEVSGYYIDTASFQWLITNRKGADGEWITNNPKYRTPHSGLGRPIPI